jgi:hypothetical protein
MIADPAVYYSSTHLSELEMEAAVPYDYIIVEGLALSRVASSKLDLRTSKLDEVIRSFVRVCHGDKIDTARLLKACRAHNELLKLGGAALFLVAKDLESNIDKAEALFKKSPKECQNLTSLLAHEKKSGIHNGSVLSDSSAAVGLLWIRRSLAFQSQLFQAVIWDREPRDAAHEAYQQQLSPYHGWVLRTVFPASFAQFPNRGEFLSVFSEVDDELEYTVVKKLRALVAVWGPLLSEWTEAFKALGLEDLRRV